MSMTKEENDLVLESEKKLRCRIKELEEVLKIVATGIWRNKSNNTCGLAGVVHAVEKALGIKQKSKSKVLWMDDPPEPMSWHTVRQGKETFLYMSFGGNTVKCKQNKDGSFTIVETLPHEVNKCQTKKSLPKRSSVKRRSTKSSTRTS